MSPGPPLAVLFTMDCLPPARKRGINPYPRTWESSARNIDGFCTRLIAAGHRPTLFCELSVVANHTPLLEEFTSAGAEDFAVSIIPHTWAHTTLLDRRVGDGVNLEADVLARYVARQMEARGGVGITESLLREKGFA